MNEEHQLENVKPIEDNANLVEKNLESLEKGERFIEDEVESIQDLTEQHYSVHVINEKDEKIPDTDSIEKPKVPINVPKEEIVVAQMSEPGGTGYNDQRNYAQTPYYQQQIRGQPVYVQAGPVDAARMAAIDRPGRYMGNTPNGYFSSSSNPSMFGETFDDVAIRNRFVQRVYTILTIQLAYSCGFIALCMFVPAVNRFVKVNIILFYISFIVEIVLLIVLLCFMSARRNFPLNFILLFIFTLAIAYISAVFSTMYSTFIVLTSMGITAGVCLLVSIFACQTSIDITSCATVLFVAFSVVFLFGIIAVIVKITTGGHDILFAVYGGLVALIFSLYLMFDTQMIMGGRKYELSPEEYIAGALLLYVDIMYIFWNILMLLGWKR